MAREAGSGYVWVVTGDLVADGATNESILKIKRDAAAKGTVRVMTWQEWKDDSSPALHIATNSGYSEPINVERIKVELEGNSTSDATDDLVRIKSITPQKRFETEYRARISAPSPLSEDDAPATMPAGNILSWLFLNPSTQQ